MKPKDWNMHINAINEWHNDAFQQEITWLKMVTHRDHHGEDSNHRPISINLKCLILYNYFRSWPLDQATNTGEIDKQSCVALFNIEWLKQNGYANQQGQLAMNPGDDKFIINGVTYVPSADSQVSQAYGNPLMFFIVLKREELETGTERY